MKEKTHRQLLIIFLIGTISLCLGCQNNASDKTVDEVGVNGAQDGTATSDFDDVTIKKFQEPTLSINNATVDFDFDKIKKRGSLIAVVDNSSTSYFIYKGNRMGYEFDLLERFADDLGVDLEIKITNDIQGAFAMLDNGNADIMAYHLTVTKERSKVVAFSDELNEVKQVLIQRKPKNWRKMKAHEIEDALIRNPLDLVGKEILVRQGSAFSSRLESLSDEIGGNINIVEVEGEVDTETLIERVSEGENIYTVADSDIGMINAAYDYNIDAKTEISFPQKIAWAMRLNAPKLKKEVDNWLGGMKSRPDFNMIYDRYFKYTRSQTARVNSDFSSTGGGKLSKYDDLIKEAAEDLSIDWMLLSSQVYQESKFDAKAESWAGAKGLMQLMDISMRQFKVKDPFNAAKNLEGGIRHMKWLEDYWEDEITDPRELIKFVLGSYNVGQGHVKDAMSLAKKFGKNPQKWDDVGYYLIQKSKSKFYNDPVVRYGYCRGTEPVNYVEDIFLRYEQYKLVLGQEQSE
jgi:membrane-bound lytic murein transglycosylase F